MSIINPGGIDYGAIFNSLKGDQTVNYTSAMNEWLNSPAGLAVYRSYIAVGLSDREASALAVADQFTGDKYADQKTARKHAVQLSQARAANPPTSVVDSVIPSVLKDSGNLFPIIAVGGILLLFILRK